MGTVVGTYGYKNTCRKGSVGLNIKGEIKMTYEPAGFDFLSFLFSYAFLGFAAVLFIAIPVVLWINRGKLVTWQKVSAAFIMGLLVIYFSLVIWLIIGFGRVSGAI